MKHKKGIAVAGNAIIDYYKEIEAYPQHSSLTTIRQIKKDLGGALCNCAIDLAKIDPDMPVDAIGLCGSDDAGDYIINQMSAFKNIRMDQIHRIGETSFTDVMVDRKNRTRTFFQFRGANAFLDIEHFDFSLLQADILHVAYILLLDTLDQPDSEYGTRMARLLDKARKQGLKTSIDVVSEESDRFKTLVPPALKYVDYCIVNETESSKTTGIPVRDENHNLLVERVIDNCRALFEYGVKEWVVIHSREGAVGMDQAGHVTKMPSIAIPEKQIINTTGAGDAFLSGALYAAWSGRNLETALKMGIASASSSLLGANATEGIIRHDQLLDFYHQYDAEAWSCFQ